MRSAAGRRNVIVSTNVAETSITIEDVVFVIDSGRMKENEVARCVAFICRSRSIRQYDAVNDMQRLVDVFVSKANAQQRRGRAGALLCVHWALLMSLQVAHSPASASSCTRETCSPGSQPSRRRRSNARRWGNCVCEPR